MYHHEESSLVREGSFLPLFLGDETKVLKDDIVLGQCQDMTKDLARSPQFRVMHSRKLEFFTMLGICWFIFKTQT